MPLVTAIFCRSPELGQVKTRLAAQRGDEFALAFYRAMLADSFTLALAVSAHIGSETVALVTPDESYFPEIAGARRLNQGAGDLWARLQRADAILCENGARHRVFIGSDAPDTPLSALVAAFAALQNHDFCVGPANDGGFYLLGAARPIPDELFERVPISSAQTLRVLTRNLENLKFSCALLPPWSDVDTAADLDDFQRRLASGTSSAPHCQRFLGL